MSVTPFVSNGSVLTLGALNDLRCTRLALLVELGYDASVASRALAAMEPALLQPPSVSDLSLSRSVLNLNRSATLSSSCSSSSSSEDDDGAPPTLPPTMHYSAQPKLLQVLTAARTEPPRTREVRVPKRRELSEASTSATSLKKSKSVASAAETEPVDVAVSDKFFKRAYFF